MISWLGFFLWFGLAMAYFSLPGLLIMPTLEVSYSLLLNYLKHPRCYEGPNKRGDEGRVDHQHQPWMGGPFRS
ncbi:hypothetical protein BJY01DRAFT_225904 [Aspergillus pseudoustus]|uniref:Uncharacterized protein n=1 Tax=Aspergillus pseudoustus TaxID=1810923 RepID=A0ABR4IX44_9EURO